MKSWGYILLIAGVFVCGYAFTVQTSVHSDASFQFGSYQPSADTLNIGLLQNQQLVFMAGCALFVGGAVLAGAGAIVEQLERGKTPVAADPLAAGTIGVEPETFTTDEDKLVAQAERASEREEADRRYNMIALWACAAIAALFVLAVFVPSKRTRSVANEAAAIEANAEAVADNLEAVADNLEAEADRTLERADKAIKRAR